MLKSHGIRGAGVGMGHNGEAWVIQIDLPYYLTEELKYELEYELQQICGDVLFEMDVTGVARAY